MIEPTVREQKWLQRLQHLVNTQPPNTHVYLSCGGPGGVLNLMRLDPDGHKIMRWEGFDPEYIIGSVSTGNWDGSDW